MRFSLCEPPTRETRPQHREHTLFGKCVGFLTSTVNHVTLNMQAGRGLPLIVLIPYLNLNI